ncbi:MAG: 16S rRNA (guanine(966)-N(2))-methyltransferase RsmD [Eubacteriales bacterium]|nr:16S rRNA (guanine(966)-N(2))-methyltransferase RsmD [Eubacteriales bacterium]MDD3289618.1 16S rRNA (guanine(966)-N(2))-methyltransferase RsmD [Eubacteriales bacterium]MDD3864567.1 16S rRNA (guanine(966)-N(2))-methyltransferase RsmD [Eubacteriales bacterium]MDD4444679.1 16S rRNA (guanine(966)-N(2))-methyltransferase RsmD [Eubacteriales bacterium]
MRIIAGSCKGRKLKTPKGDEIRPTSDRVKEAVFSILVPFINEDTVVADLFCGTGNMGLEALSRGAGRAYFSDLSKDSLALAMENIKACGFEEKSILLKGDYRQNLQRIRENVDIYFLDPPYDGDMLTKALADLSGLETLSEEAIIACEHRSRQAPPEIVGRLHLWKQRRYGATSVSIYKPDERG